MRVLRNLFSAIAGGSEDWRVNWFLYLAIVGGLAAWFLTLPFGERATGLMLDDPDNYQRLVEVRDWLGGQSWWDTRQYRVDPPTGLQVHWSRLADVPLALVILFFSLFTDYGEAEMLAVVCLPPILLLVTAVFLGRAARNIGGIAAERFAQFFLVAASVVLAQFIPGRIDHHGLQMLLFAGALAAATADPTKKSGVLTALPVSISLLIGLETAPLLLAIPAWMALGWICDGEPRKAELQGFLVGLLVFLTALYALSVAPADWGRQTHDQIGIGHMAIIVTGATVLAAALQIEAPTLGRRMAIVAVCGFAAALPLIAFPGVLASPYGAIEPELQQLWIGTIVETESAWDIAKTDPLRLLTFHLFPFLALAAGFWIYPSADRQPKMVLVLMVGTVGFALSVWQIRGVTPAALVALLLSSVIMAHLRVRRDMPFGWPRYLAAIAALNGLFGPTIYFALVPEGERRNFAIEQPALSERCEIHLRGDAFNQVKPGLALNGIHSGALILARTHHSVLALGNHRAVKGNGEAYRLILDSSAGAREEIVGSSIDYLLTCRDNELRNLAGYAPESLAADLYFLRTPDWLVPLPHGGGEQVLFYAIKRDDSVSERPKTGQPSK